MKKFIFLLMIFAGAMITCKKEYHCECVTTKTVYLSNEPSVSKFSDTYTYTTKKEEDARTSCMNEHNVDPGPITQQQVKNSTLITQVECDLK